MPVARFVFPFLSLYLFPCLTIAQSHCGGKEIPFQVSIAGRTDSITVAAIIAAGKPECPNKAFEIVRFTVAHGGDCLTEGLYTEVSCTEGRFSPMALALIRRLRPGRRLYLDCVQVGDAANSIYLRS